MEGEWAAKELEEMMPEQSQAAAMGATLEEREVKAMRGSKHAYVREAERERPSHLVYWKGVGVEDESSHSFG